MLTLGSNILKQPVMSLHLGAKVASLKSPVINPDNLKIEAYEILQAVPSQEKSFLMIADVREIGPLGFIIDSIDEFVSSTDVIQLEKLCDIDFQIAGIQVIDEDGKKLGKVKDYSIDLGSFYINKLHIRRNLLGRISETELLVDRSQVIEVTDNYIKVRSAREKKLAPVEASMDKLNNYVNPFRKPTTAQPETTDAREN